MTGVANVLTIILQLLPIIARDMPKAAMHLTSVDRGPTSAGKPLAVTSECSTYGHPKLLHSKKTDIAPFFVNANSRPLPAAGERQLWDKPGIT